MAEIKGRMRGVGRREKIVDERGEQMDGNRTYDCQGGGRGCPGDLSSAKSHNTAVRGKTFKLR